MWLICFTQLDLNLFNLLSYKLFCISTALQQRRVDNKIKADEDRLGQILYLIECWLSYYILSITSNDKNYTA